MIVLSNGNKVHPDLWKKAEFQIKDVLSTGKTITGQDHEVISVSFNESLSSISVGVQIKLNTKNSNKYMNQAKDVSNV